MKCYFPGCEKKGITKEHIPPRSFFPKGEKEQLLTVKSCEDHNNAKCTDDLYVLAQICINASPSNRAREIFLKKIAPQLNFNGSALRKRLAKDSVQLPDGTVKYPVDVSRFDEFFTALSCGLIFKACDAQLPAHFDIGHIYPNFASGGNPEIQEIENSISEFYTGEPMKVLNFGKPNTQNERIYTVEIFGMPNFKSSITIVHMFYGKFKVVSMLTNRYSQIQLTSQSTRTH